MLTSSSGEKSGLIAYFSKLYRNWRATGRSSILFFRSTLVTKRLPLPTLASNTNPIFRGLFQSGSICTKGFSPNGRLSSTICLERATTSHHCQLEWNWVGKFSKAGDCGSQRIPNKLGGIPDHTVFQEIPEKTGSASEWIAPVSAINSTFPPFSR